MCSRKFYRGVGVGELVVTLGQLAFCSLTLRCPTGGGQNYPQDAFTGVSLEPINIQQCVFMTFPEYGPATECYI